MTRTSSEVEQDARQLLELVSSKPGRAFSYYATQLHLEHPYAAKLFAILEGLGELTSAKVTVYRPAVKA
ncbi:hypothetical protein [Deinococcus sp. PEB2-63]